MEHNWNSNELLRIEDLVVEYTSGHDTIHAVNGVSFSLYKGKTLGLVGETGAGKTTIAKSIMRILPDPPAKIKNGKILFEGESLLELPEKKMKKIRGNKISMIFQDPMTALNPIFTVGDQVAESIRVHDKTSKKESYHRMIELLEMVGIPGERCTDYPHQFSGGMKQRIVIAIALACHPQLLLADEPTTALDVTIQAQVLKLMRELRDKLGTAMIMITHDLGIIAETCDDVAVVYAGEIVEIGSGEQIYDRTAHPYTKGLFESLPGLSSDEKRLKPIPGEMADPTVIPPGCRFYERCQFACEKCKSKIPLREIEPGHYTRCIL